MAGTFQGNLQGTPSRPLEYLTSSKAVTASYALESRKLGTADVGGPSQSMYLSGGLPVAVSSTIGSKTKPVYVNGGRFTPGDDIPTSKTGSWDSVANWVTANSGSITGLTGSTTESIANIGGLLAASGSWNSASQWVGSNSASISASVNKVNNLKGITFQTGAFTAKTYHPTGSQQTVNVPSTAAHVGAVSTASFNAYTSSAAAAMDEYLPKTGGTITGSLTITQNLTVQGTTVSIDAQNLNVKDKLILVASGSNTRDAANGAGIAVQTASAGEGGAARIQYESAGNRFTSSVNFAAPGFTGSLQGTASYSTTASYALKATSASWTAEANHAVSASEALHAGNATSASYASSSTSASYANKSTTASYALVAESVKDGAGLVVNTASYAVNAGTASYVNYTNVAGKPTFYTESFQAGAFSAKKYHPTSGSQIINIPTITTHISGLDAVTASVKLMVSKSASWDGMANTASAAYISASHALLTASQAVKEAESASYWNTEASKSAYSAALYATTASGSMEDARIYRANAATNATLSSTYAVQSSASAQLAAASASAAHTSANKAASSASKAANWAVSSSASANQAAYYAVSASASNTTIQQLAANVKQYYDNTTASAAQAATSATNAGNSATTATSAATRAGASASAASQSAYQASASAALLYKATGSATQPVYITADGPTPATAYADATVKTANSVSVAAVNTNANLPVLIAAAATPANPGPVKYDTNLTYNASTNRLNVGHVSATGLTGSLRGNVVGNVTGTASFATSASQAVTASYALIAESVKDGAGLVVNTASYALLAEEAKTALTASYNAEAAALRTIITDNSASWATDNDTKVTSAANHYKATNQISGSQGGTNTTYVHAITLDAAGHVTAVSTTNTSSIKAASASFATNASQLGGKAANQYASASHTHDYATPAQVTASINSAAFLPISGGTLTGALTGTSGTFDTVTVQKNLYVNGTASYVNTTDLIVKDKLILVSSGSTTRALANGAGIAVQTGSATTVAAAEAAAAKFYYDGTNNVWSGSVPIQAASFTGSLLGTASRAVSASRADSAASATTATSASRATSAASADSATSATTATTASYNKAGADALAWISSNSSSALTKYHPLSGTLTTPLKVAGITSSVECEISGARDKNQYWRVTGNSHSIGFGIGNGNTNRGIYQFSGSGGTAKTGWLLLWDNTYTASFLAGYRVKADGFIGSLQGNATTATRATLLTNATSGSSTQPVYISAGKPTACSGYVVTAAQTASWDAKQAAISDLDTIRNNAASGSTAFGWGNHASAGYVKSSGVTSYTLTTSSDYVAVDNAAAVTSTGTRKIDLATKSKNAINWVIANSGSAATAITNNHTHSNKAVLDGITAADTASWDGKWTYNEATIKAVKVTSASRADSAASATSATSATTATKLAGTSGSTTTPVWVNGGVPTACAGTVVSTADRNTWTTASNRAVAADDGLTTPLYGNQSEQDNVVYRGAFKIVDASGGSISIDITDDEVPSTPSSPETVYGAGVKTKLSIWGGLILNVAGTVEFYSETGASFVWSENSVDIEAGGTYEFNCIQYESGGTIYGIVTKYSES